MEIQVWGAVFFQKRRKTSKKCLRHWERTVHWFYKTLHDENGKLPYQKKYILSYDFVNTLLPSIDLNLSFGCTKILQKRTRSLQCSGLFEKKSQCVRKFKLFNTQFSLKIWHRILDVFFVSLI